jgi:hypothetical protein
VSRRDRPGRSAAGPCSRPGRPQQQDQVHRWIARSGLQQIGRPFPAAGVQDLTGRRSGPPRRNLIGSPGTQVECARPYRYAAVRSGRSAPSRPVRDRGGRERQDSLGAPRRAAGGRTHQTSPDRVQLSAEPEQASRRATNQPTARPGAASSTAEPSTRTGPHGVYGDRFCRNEGVACARIYAQPCIIFHDSVGALTSRRQLLHNLFM